MTTKKFHKLNMTISISDMDVNAAIKAYIRERFPGYDIHNLKITAEHGAVAELRETEPPRHYLD